MNKDDLDQIKDGALELLAIAAAAMYKEAVAVVGLPQNQDTLRGAIAWTVVENMGDHKEHKGNGEVCHCVKETYETVFTKAAKLLDMEVTITL